ncbi:unnamed protein product [Caenorhabditis sp. 36 PRJEB53466]|nr:unnamed protein product [Caenorhabditis sp. 36 PRJEB53466]
MSVLEGSPWEPTREFVPTEETPTIRPETGRCLHWDSTRIRRPIGLPKKERKRRSRLSRSLRESPLQSPAIVIAKSPKRRFNGFTCGILSWFVGACCLVLLCLAISEVAYHRQRDQAFLRLKWAELRQRMLGYELLSQQQELDRLALEKQSPVEALPLRRSDDPIKPKIVDVIHPAQLQDNKASSAVSSASSSEESNDGVKPVFSQYANEQTEKFGFLQALMDKIRKHAQSMGLKGDMQVHVVEVKPLFSGNKDTSVEDNASFEQSLADGFGEYAMPHQDFGQANDAYDNDRLTFDRHGMNRPFGPFNRFESHLYEDYSEPEQQQQNIQQFPQKFQWNMPPPQFGFQQQQANWWGPQQRQPVEVQTNQWNDDFQKPRFFPGFPPVPVVQFQQQPAQQQSQQQPWYQPYNDNNQNQMPMNNGAPQVWQQNDDWMAKTQENQAMPFQPNPTASQWNEQPLQQQQQQQNNDFNARMDVISDDAVAPQSTVISADRPEKVNVKSWVQPAEEQAAEENVISPDPTLESIDDGKFLPIRSDDKPIDAADAHLFQIDDPSSFKR